MAKKTISEIREEPGMSNAGTYKDVAKDDFCGPKGTYPVDTLKRAKSALKLAHNAGSKRKIKKIKDCVYRKYPQLKPKDGASMSNAQHAKNLLDTDPVVNKSIASAKGDGGAAMKYKDGASASKYGAMLASNIEKGMSPKEAGKQAAKDIKKT